MKKLAFAAFLAMPGSFDMIALLCIHPRMRAEMAEASGMNVLLDTLNRNAALLLLVVVLYRHSMADRHVRR